MGAGAVSLVARVEVLCIHTRMYTNKYFLDMMQSGKYKLVRKYRTCHG